VIVSAEAAGRVEQVEIDYMRTRTGALAGVTGNPYGAAVRPAGTGWAFLAAGLPGPFFNHVVGLSAGSAELAGSLAATLAGLANWYAAHGLPLRADVTPAQASPQLFAALTAQGLSQTGFYAGLYAEVPAAPPGPAAPAAPPGVAAPPAPVLVEEADPEEFAQAYAVGFGFPPVRRAGMAVSISVLAGRADTSFYRARLGPRTAGVGLLFQSGDIGYLATAATLPDFRGQGVQTALIRHRSAAARDRGCDLVAGHAAAGSVSQRAMERCGLRLAFTKALWSAPAPTPA
jgi:GNAT superfamily N-acetyltransferase